jgi:hypothetical protein
MIELTLKNLNDSFEILKLIASKTPPPPPGAFRKNFRAIFEQCQMEKEGYDKEMTDLLREHSYKPLGNGQWAAPSNAATVGQFIHEIDRLNSTRIEIRGSHISLSEIYAIGIDLTVIDEILLSKWLLIPEDFPVELEQSIDQSREVVG